MEEVTRHLITRARARAQSLRAADHSTAELLEQLVYHMHMLHQRLLFLDQQRAVGVAVAKTAEEQLKVDFEIGDGDAAWDIKLLLNWIERGDPVVWKDSK